MTSHRITIALAGVFALGIASLAPPASAAQRVLSEPARNTKAAATLYWRAESFPAKLVARLQYGEMSTASILRVERYNARRRMKPAQIGINRTASTEGATASLPALNWIALKDGSSVARIELRSPVALALRVGLQIRALDPRAELRFAGSSEPSRIVAVMSGKEILQLADAKSIFWTPSTDGETQFIEVYLPVGVSRSSVNLQAPSLSHLLADSKNDFKIITKIGESGSCNVDTACRVGELGANFVNAKNSVAHMQFVITGEGTFICTGTLLADTVAASQIPYFYSANHCIDNQTVASTLNTFWKYEATACNSGVVAANVQLSGGATYLYSDPDTSAANEPINGTDGLLLRLNNTPPAGSEFAGWDSTLLPTSSNIIGIHHPSGDVKKVSSGQQVTRDSYVTTVGWLSGTTEGGSSGSGLFTADATGYYLRGGLYGGSATCDNTGSLGTPENRDIYSRFDVVFPHIQRYLAPVAHDFDADGKSDLLWRNSSSGSNSIWRSALSTQVQTVRIITDINWTAAGIGDFNGDGKADVLWNHKNTGANALWYSANSATAANLTTVTDLSWKISGVGDFDGDGKDDVLWRNKVTGKNSYWRSGNYATQVVVREVTDVQWVVAGVGDFNGDGKDDILWNHKNTGASALWYSANSTTAANLTTVTDLSWRISGVGDFDGDGKDDILWRNKVTGKNSYWRSGNYATQIVVRDIPDVSWKVGAVADYNGDGKDDIVWRHASTGGNAMWYSANSATAQNLTAVADPNWKIMPLPHP